MEYIERRSPNYDSRAGAIINSIVIHHTEMPDAESALELLCQVRPKGNVSCHYLIAKDGTIFRLVEEEMRAWHAGVSYWRGQEGLNQSSIGIELDNNGFEPFPEAQIVALIALCHEIMRRHPIEQRNIVGHSDIAIGRKVDPNAYFPWHQLAKAGLGLFPEVYLQTPEITLLTKEATGDKVKEVQEKLQEVGYQLPVTGVVNSETLLTFAAFQLHYVPKNYILGGLQWSNLDNLHLTVLLELIGREKGAINE
jgi:N-acetylmuramoyl-L-alanine amidase